MTARDHVREDLGGFVLGALDPAEDERLRLHLALCAECRRAHDRLATVAPALALLQQPNAARAEAPPGLEAAVMRGVARERDQRTRGSRPGWRDALGGLPGRAALAGALAGCAATVAALAVSGAFSDQDPPVQTVDLSSAGSPARASAQLRTDAAGTQVRLQARGPAPTTRDEIYEVWLVREDGRVSAGTFTAPTAQKIEVTLTTAARSAAYGRIGITREPDALDPARNGPNVLTGELGED